MWISLIIFTATGIQTIFEFIGKFIKNKKVMSIIELIVYILLILVILWIVYGIATKFIIISKNVVK